MAPVAASASEVFSCSGVGVEFEVSGRRLSVLEEVSFSLARGQFLSILGHSGTGKTTLLRVLGGLLEPAPGSSVRFQGREVTQPPDGVVIVFQNYTASLLPWRTVEKNVALGLERTVARQERKERVRAALEMVGLHHRSADYPWRLSGGMQQRVQIARAIAMRPQVLLMDEPFGALDAMTKSQLQDELARLHQMTATTVIFVTHDIEEAVYLSDRVLVLAGSPARVEADISIDLPRPRDQMTTKELPEYLRLRHSVYEAIQSGKAHGH